jgi:hypothetical protein
VELNYYLKDKLHQLEIHEPCPGCGKIDQLAVHDLVTSCMHDRRDWWIGCNCGWSGPTVDNPIEAAKAWDIRIYLLMD